MTNNDTPITAQHKGGLFDLRLTRLQGGRLFWGTVSTLVVILATELVCRFFSDANSPIMGLALPPSETIRYEARDFHFTVTTNRLGFRGPEVSVQRAPGVSRILVLGNSFTYGWGVDYESTWPKLLQDDLRALGGNYETLNLATPGTSARELIEIGQRAIPLLKPDWVIISVLQGGALFTFNGGLRTDQESERPASTKSILVAKLKYILPGYVALLQDLWLRMVGARPRSAAEVREAWRNEAKYFLTHMTTKQSQHYQALDPATADRFVSGDLNVAAVRAAIVNPDVFVDTVRSEQMIRNGEITMQLMFSTIRKIAEANDGRVLVVSMPYGAYLGGGPAENLRRMGFNIPDFLSRDETTENRIRRAAKGAQVEFVSVLNEFQKVNPDPLFIPFDGHYNGNGTRLYSKLLSQELFRSRPSLFVKMER